MALSELRYRLGSPAAQALRGAGPPLSHTVWALAAAGVVDIGLFLATAGALPWVEIWPIAVVIPVLATAIVAIRDRDGWVVRQAMAYCALAQRRSWRGKLLGSAWSFDRWLADPANADLGPLERAAALVNAERLDDARGILDSFESTTDLEFVRRLRLRSTLAVAQDPNIEIDVDAVRAASANLSPAEKQYQVVGAAWTRAWNDIRQRRSWRPRFGIVAREFAPYDLPLRLRLLIAVQQLDMPIAIALAALVVWAVVIVLS